MLPFRLSHYSVAIIALLGLCLGACGGESSPDPGSEVAAGTGTESGSSADPLVEVEQPEPEPEPAQAEEASTDPEHWTPLDSWKGQAVETVRELHKSGGLKRIRTRLPGVVGPEGFHGPELVYHPNAALKLAKTWVSGRPHGVFKTWFPSGIVKRTGSFDMGDLHGPLTEYWKIGSVSLEANYEHGKLHGRVAEYFGDDNLKDESHWVFGSQVGTHKIWSLEGILVLEEQYHEGQRDGSHLAYYPSTGERRLEGTYLSGQKTGLWRGWTEDGVLVAEESFELGKRHGSREAFIASVLVERLQFDHGAKHGQQEEFYEDGAKRSAGRMDQGNRVGLWSYWKPDGSLLVELSGTYENDKRISD
ncbi:MAG: antitoxin component YwqK of YwqJK toxin-antitoxin module [Planctomycetota bacterium]|jgi:antitoxin component YwqK of YwqJK toxin-antitoxin module